VVQYDRRKGEILDEDNMGAAYGELPDAAALRKMEQLIESLPGG
jgi:hypothetical protein